MGHKHLFDKWTEGLSAESAIIEVFSKVRDIPFQFIGSRDIDSMLDSGVGTCTAKHMLLKEMFGYLSLESRFIVDKMNLTDFIKGLDHSDYRVIELETIGANLVPYYHTHLELKRSGWRALDITFDACLAKFGFVAATEWDGSSHTQMPHTSLERYVVDDDPGVLKGSFLKDEPAIYRRCREEFFGKLNEYIISLRAR